MKKGFVTALIGTMVLSLAACGKTADTGASVPAATEAAPTAAAETEEKPEATEGATEDKEPEIEEDVIDKPDFTGIYSEPVSGRCSIEIVHTGGDEHKINVRWSGSAYESSNWEITATYYVSTGLLEYTGAKYYVRTYTDEEHYTDDVKYTDGSGEFWFEEDGSLGWRSANSDIDGITGETFFERLPVNADDPSGLGMANPWTDVDSADAAAEGAGVGYFMVPANKESYNDHQVYISGFRYMEHLAEANGSIGSAELTIRKGLKQDSEDVSGDYTEYAHSWSFENEDGFVINCFGNEEGKAMKTIWLSDNFSYSINVCGQGDESDTFGLSEDTLKLLIADTQ
ncbi:MAG: hypothetical protein IK115_01035 [Lachnospiraceae bacterium]|nr:hypothetical protein [Lachnospiraceae bacterium]